MDETTFLRTYAAEKPVLEAWGNFVTETILNGLKVKLGRKAETFIRIPPRPRLKEDGSLVDKAFFRGKPYQNPYLEITDKIGVRFVVLLTKDVNTVNEVIEHGIHWKYSKDRDHKEEQEKRPLIFDYQSDHYILRSGVGLKFDEVEIPEGLPCEVQIRTLLQHAYSELTHDTIYKTNTKPGSDMYRVVARSMALLETADQQLTHVAETIGKQVDAFEYAKNLIAEKYEEFLGCRPVDSRLNDQIIASYQAAALQATMPLKLKQFIESNKFLKDAILERREVDVILKQSSSLLLMMELSRDRYSFEENWPFQPTLLDGMFTILGMAR